MVDLSNVARGDRLKTRGEDCVFVRARYKYCVYVSDEMGNTYFVSFQGEVGAGQPSDRDIVEIVDSETATSDNDILLDLSNVKVGDMLKTRGCEYVRVCYISPDFSGGFPIIVSRFSDSLRYSVTLTGSRYPAGIVHNSDIIEIEFKPLTSSKDDAEQFWDAMSNMATKEEFLGYCKLNAIKHVSRCNKKNGIIDLKKAVTYCERMIRFLEEGTMR